MSRHLMVSANAETLRSFAQELLADCDVALNADGTSAESIGVELTCEYNGSGPHLFIRFDNDDCEGDHISNGQVLWEEGS